MEDRKPNESQFINFNPIKALTILAELLAEQEGKKAVNIKIYKKGENSPSSSSITTPAMRKRSIAAHSTGTRTISC